MTHQRVKFDPTGFHLLAAVTTFLQQRETYRLKPCAALENS